MSSFERLGRWCAQHPWPVIAIWLLLFAVSVPAFLQLPAALKVGGFSDEHTESARARAELQDRLGYNGNALIVLFTSPTLSASDPAFVDQVHAALADVQHDPAVQQIVWHTDNFRQVGLDKHTAYEVLILDPKVDAGPPLVARLKSELHPTNLKVLLGGEPAFYSDIEAVSAADLHRAEIIAFPFAAIALLLVFRTLIAAAVPVIVGGLGVAVSSGIIYLVAQVTDMSIFVLNVSTMIGLGLGVDYSLFVTSRFREELPRRLADSRTTRQAATIAAVQATAATAGRAVFFSGLTVCLGLTALVGFNYMLLRSVGIGGCLVVFCTVAAALTLLPAVLALLGPRIDALQFLPRSRAVTLFWERLAHAVMARPLALGVPALAFLLFLGLPFLHVRLSSPDASILPTSVPSRQAFDLLNSDFPTGETTPMLVAIKLPGNVLGSDNLARLYEFTHQIAADQRVARVDSIVTLDPRLTLPQYELLYADPAHIPDGYASAMLDGTVKGDTVLVQVYSKDTATSPASEALLLKIRGMSLGAGTSILVDGATAEVHDVVGTLYHDFPLALLFIVLTTYAVLLILFRSAILPLKAVIMNSLSILASYGALVFVFQEGHFSTLLNFSELGYVEATLPILMFCTLFGLSMDYEVFLLTRIQEAYAVSGDNRKSVAEGMRQSGRIITSAAAIVVLVSVSFMAADVVLIKALGLGVALAILLDATVVRAVLVPAAMRLLGDWNWWLPKPLAMRWAAGSRRLLRPEG